MPAIYSFRCLNSLRSAFSEPLKLDDTTADISAASATTGAWIEQGCRIEWDGEAFYVTRI